MVEGKGWGNEDFLDSLGGSSEDRENSLDQYERFQESRAEFAKRQEEMMKNPKVQEFMRARAERERGARGDPEGDGFASPKDDLFGGGGSMMDGADDESLVGSGGGTRFRRMMGNRGTLKERLQQQQQQQQQGFPFDQVGLVNDEDESEGS